MYLNAYIVTGLLQLNFPYVQLPGEILSTHERIAMRLAGCQ